MKFIKYLLFVILPIITSCSKNKIEPVSTANSWEKIADFGNGLGRYGLVSFSVENSAYVGLGSDYHHSYNFGEPIKWDGGLKNDFWKYNSENNTWTRLKDFPGGKRIGAVGFSLNGKGYIGLGELDDGLKKDFWEYDPINDSWIQLPDFPGEERSNPVSFVVNNKAYVGCGSDKRDFWVFSSSDNSWTQLPDYPGEGYNVVALNIDKNGYVGLGINAGNVATDFWQYIPDSNIWKQKQSIPIPVYNNSTGIDYEVASKVIGFSVKNQGYVCLTNTDNSLWKYNPRTDEWIEMNERLPSSNKLELKTSFVINEIAFLGTGLSVNLCGNHCQTTIPTSQIYKLIP